MTITPKAQDLARYRDEFRGAIADFLEQERPARLQDMQSLAEYSPFRQEQ